MRRRIGDIGRRLLACVIGIALSSAGCVHHIHVTPPTDTASTTLPFDVELTVPFLAMEGADHMPGILYLDWSAEALRRTLIEYFSHRQTFRSVTTAQPADLQLVVKAWLTMRAPDRYLYRVHLESEIAVVGRPTIKTYRAEGEALGSSVRWVTASDQGPITAATVQALRSLASQIEQDHGVIMDQRTP